MKFLLKSDFNRLHTEPQPLQNRVAKGGLETKEVEQENETV